MKTITLTKEIQKRIDTEKYYSNEDFIRDAQFYIAAVKSGRIKYTVMRVSKSGMSRLIRIESFEGKINNGYYRDYFMMLRVLGFSINKHDDVVITGCGMNMVFATNYEIIFLFYRIGLITKKTRNILCQKVN